MLFEEKRKPWLPGERQRRTVYLCVTGDHETVFGENGVTRVWFWETVIRPWRRSQVTVA